MPVVLYSPIFASAVVLLCVEHSFGNQIHTLQHTRAVGRLFAHPGQTTVGHVDHFSRPIGCIRWRQMPAYAGAQHTRVHVQMSIASPPSQYSGDVTSQPTKDGLGAGDTIHLTLAYLFIFLLLHSFGARWKHLGLQF